MTKKSLGIWSLVTVVVVLATRAIVYALAPQSVLLAALAHNELGPSLTAPLAAGCAASAVLAATVLWLAAAGVRERLVLEGRPLVRAPRLRPGLLGARLVVLFLATSLSFAMVESTIHWRDGLGWHGLHCLTGPVHRNAIPVLAALSLVAVAIHGAIEHFLAWVHRLVAQLAARARACAPPVAAGFLLSTSHPGGACRLPSARGPPPPAPSLSISS